MTQCLRPAVTDPVLLMFSRRQVETCDIEEPLHFLLRLTANRHTALEFCGRISLVVDGYNDDPREQFEVPEVRAYITRLDARDTVSVVTPITARAIGGGPHETS